MNSLPSLYSERPIFSHGPAGGDSVRGSNFPNGEWINPEASLMDDRQLMGYEELPNYFLL